MSLYKKSLFLGVFCNVLSDGFLTCIIDMRRSSFPYTKFYLRLVVFLDI